MARKTANTFNFLGLYPEIRENIFIEFALIPNAHAPLTVPERDTRIRGPGYSRGVFFSPTFKESQFTSLPLLLVNHQLHDEFTACMKRLARSKEHRYELVVELINEKSMHPTWMLVPIKTTHIPVVYAQFCISNSPGGMNGGSGWSPGDGGPEIMGWGLLGLLRTFVRGGPLLGWKKVSQGWPRTVDALVLEVKTPEPVDGVYVRTRETLTPVAVHSGEHVAYVISSYI